MNIKILTKEKVNDEINTLTKPINCLKAIKIDWYDSKNVMILLNDLFCDDDVSISLYKDFYFDTLPNLNIRATPRKAKEGFKEITFTGELEELICRGWLYWKLMTKELENGIKM